VTENWTECTHLVSDKVRRTLKFLGAVVRGKPIVGVQWLAACKKSGGLLSEERYLLRDTKGEKAMGFSLQSSLVQARARVAGGSGVFSGHRFFALPQVKHSMSEGLQDLVEAAGGIVITSVPPSALATAPDAANGIWVLGANEDQGHAAGLLARGFTVYSKDLVTHSLLRQEMCNPADFVTLAPC
jgi:mediator of DNA damage checkpoint protein 1